MLLKLQKQSNIFLSDLLEGRVSLILFNFIERSHKKIIIVTLHDLFTINDVILINKNLCYYLKYTQTIAIDSKRRLIMA